MARKKHIVDSRAAYLVIWGIEQNFLRAAIVSLNRTIEIGGEYLPLDKELLPLLQKQEKNLKQLSGIALVADALGGFASSRLLLATLNTYAWLREVPIVAVPASWQEKEHSALLRLLDQKCRGSNQEHQVLPVYKRPADTTISKKKKKFSLIS